MVSPDSSREQWVATQINLGALLSMLGELSGDEAVLHEAAEALVSAISRIADREQWGTIQLNLTSVLIELAERGDTQALRDAWDASRMAAANLDPRSNAEHWAQANLARAYTLRLLHQFNDPDLEEVMGLRGRVLQEALSAIEQALSAVSVSSAPDTWAAAQLERGIFYSVLGDSVVADPSRTPLRRRCYELAINSYTSALQVIGEQSAPAKWSDAQNDLGLAYLGLARMGDAPGVQLSIQSFQNALRYRTRDRSPGRWAETQANLAFALEVRSTRTQSSILPALEAAQFALEGFTQVNNQRGMRMANDMIERYVRPD
jgi:tetratricopeptide (TPR) repeat protein